MSHSCFLDFPFTPTSQAPPNQLSLPMLKSWLSCYSYPSTTAGPLVATTITIEAIQDLLHANGYPIEAPSNVDMFSGPFDDTQFDAVVDVETCDDGIDLTGLKFTDLDACSEDGYCDSNLLEDDIKLLEDLPLSPDSPLLSDSADIDFGCDSGIEAEMDEPHDASENEKEKKEKSKASDDKKSSGESTQGGSADNQQQNDLKPRTENKKPDDKTRETQEEGDEIEVDEDEDKDKDDNDDNDNDLPQIKCQYLWEFLHHILLEKHNKYLAWKNQAKGVFRLIDHNGLAKLWGKHKNRKNMTYEKLSRALRYYYSKDILRKVPGQRLTYKFVHNLNGKKYPL